MGAQKSQRDDDFLTESRGQCGLSLHCIMKTFHEKKITNFLYYVLTEVVHIQLLQKWVGDWKLKEEEEE